MERTFERRQGTHPMGQQPTRSRSRARLALLSLALLATPAADVFAAKPVDAREYQLDISHRVVSQSELDGGKLELQLELTLNNGGTHGLYDVRLFLMPAGIPQLAHACAPARMRSLNAGKQDGMKWTYECLIAPLPDEPSRRLQFRVEAVDVDSQEIVSFVSTSQEGR